MRTLPSANSGSGWGRPCALEAISACVEFSRVGLHPHQYLVTTEWVQNALVPPTNEQYTINVTAARTDNVRPVQRSEWVRLQKG